LALPPDPELLADLAAGRWVVTAAGIKMESKEEIRKRLGRSPDCADAVVLAHLPGALPFEIGLPPKEHRSILAQAPEGVFMTNNAW
jgi:hypothetical protein